MARQRKRRQYATGSLYQRKGDGRWIATIEAGFTRSGARRRITLSAKTELEAKRKMEKRRSELARGEAATSGRVTVKAWGDTWLAMTSRTARPKSHTTDRGAVAKWIVPTIGHKRLDQLAPSDVRAVETAIRGAGHTSSTARRYMGVLRRMLKAASREGHAVPPLALDVDLPGTNANDRTAVATADALKMLKAASDLPDGSRWAAAFLQGMRQGECLGLTWDQVDDETLTICWQLQALPYLDKDDRSKGFRIPDGAEVRQVDRSLHLVRPKSQAGWRVLPLIPVMADAMARWRNVCPESQHGLVWPGAGGMPRRSTADRDEWRGLQDAADVRHPSGRYYELHEARHATATLLMELKVPEAVIIAIMGHSSIVTSQAYMHVDQTLARDALTRVAERLGLS